MVDIFKAIACGLVEDLILPYDDVNLNISINSLKNPMTTIRCEYRKFPFWEAELARNGVIVYCMYRSSIFLEYCDPGLVDKIQENLTESVRRRLRLKYG